MRATEFKIYNNTLMKGMCKASTLKTIIQSSGKLRPKCGIKERDIPCSWFEIILFRSF